MHDCEHEYYYYLFTVDDVSAQTSCVIDPTNVTTLRIINGLRIPLELNCQCLDGNGMMIAGTSWFFNGNRLTSATEGTYNVIYLSSAVYYSNIAVGNLSISGFGNSDTGTYTCGPTNTFPTGPPSDTITLTSGEYIAKYNSKAV